MKGQKALLILGLSALFVLWGLYLLGDWLKNKKGRLTNAHSFFSVR